MAFGGLINIGMVKSAASHDKALGIGHCSIYDQNTLFLDENSNVGRILSRRNQILECMFGPSSLRNQKPWKTRMD